MALLILFYDDVYYRLAEPASPLRCGIGGVADRAARVSHLTGVLIVVRLA